MVVFMHWMQAQWPHGITAVSHGLVQQTGQFVDDAAAVVDRHLAVADWPRQVRPPTYKMKCRITIGLLLPVKVIWLLKAIGICYRVLVHRGNGNRAYGLSGILFSGFWLIWDIEIGFPWIIGEFVIGVLVYRGFGNPAFDLSRFCYRANGNRAFGYRPYVVLPRNVSPANLLSNRETCGSMENLFSGN